MRALSGEIMGIALAMIALLGLVLTYQVRAAMARAWGQGEWASRAGAG